ncbi:MULTISPECIES: peptidoglycan binding protein CsiV [unclassified Pseudoalteromonas]|uniref:peptidoglycan binding protein CsiV n=1 Tax=unclassified Pseudoalteromonas TaxID=194690 RepID=UPI000B3CF6EA|nr:MULTISPECIES: peptidoglycan binding protein CsiV [unclassified Pseudoalteromonas]MDN3377659.1 peptidoglycan binding protein CsiV [Pseudoalteromonas sp. APC 3893]MDN3385855.1 peptidoglycan binding protein CsiV [Pseudoalteromonas sp. APC 4017]OUS72829.1 hypothetical protein B5G52_06475 [Pseudoalteromonas sp. A601]
MLLKKSLLILCCVFSSAAFAERWFEVEVLIFKQRPAPYLQEDFSLKKEPIKASNKIDLLTPLYAQQAKQECIAGDSRFSSTSLTDTVIGASRSSLCDDTIDYIASYDSLPLSPEAETRDDMVSTYLLNPEQLQFKSQQRELVRKGLKPLLHTGWRFEGASKSRSQSIKLFGGQHLTTPPITNTSLANNANFISLVNPSQSFEPAMQQASEKWELDGFFNIYLRHYLYINANIDISEKRVNGEIQSARFSQFKRVISGEVHYFDHPKMGMIVQIRKFKH